MGSPTNTSVSRRQFLQTTGAAVAMAATHAGPARADVANDTIRIGCIGVGGRSRHLLSYLVKIPGAKVTTICDVNPLQYGPTKQIVGEDIAMVTDYRRILDNKDIDAVLIATPDHWHTRMTIDACMAGKDVYVEKPLTHTLQEGRNVVAAQNQYQRIVQVGMQQRSMPQVQKAREIIQSGSLGKIHKVHLTWNRNRAPAMTAPKIDAKQVDWAGFLGPAPRQPFDAYRLYNWRWFWDFGGGVLTDLMCHQMDITNWFLDLSVPQKAVTVGDTIRAVGVWETPDTIQTLVHYPEKQLQVYFEGGFNNAVNRAGCLYMGEQGNLYVDRGRCEVLPEEGKSVEPFELVLGKGPKGADFYPDNDGETPHLKNWLYCIRTREKPIAPAEAGVQAVWACHLGNQAFLSGGLAEWVDREPSNGPSRWRSREGA